MFAETAAKSTEIVELTWDQLELEKALVIFSKKGKLRQRKLKISNELVSALKLREKNSGRVFLNYDKQPFTYDKLRALLNEFKRKKLYRKDWSPADLRHSFAVNFLERGESLKDLQQILGHWSVFETKKLYGDVVNGQDNKPNEIKNPFNSRG